jgi:hypothetical protein
MDHNYKLARTALVAFAIGIFCALALLFFLTQ